MAAYYNENDPKMAAWLTELIRAGLIAEGDVDVRSIELVRPSDLRGFTQCHFFAGIGGWSYALRLAGWPDDRPVWTGSCPCQPWSVANVAEGGGQGVHDARDLWPCFRRLIVECRPSTVFGEQVARAVAFRWLDAAFLDLEEEAYACGAAVLPALAVDAIHERQRLFFVAHANSKGREGRVEVQRVSVSTEKTLPIDCDPLAGARRVLAGDLDGVLPCYGVSVQMERDALKGFGNSILPQVGAEFVMAYMDVIASSP